MSRSGDGICEWAPMRGTGHAATADETRFSANIGTAAVGIVIANIPYEFRGQHAIGGLRTGQ